MAVPAVNRGGPWPWQRVQTWAFGLCEGRTPTRNLRVSVGILVIDGGEDVKVAK